MIPMGAARLRITTFPVIGQGSAAHVWQGPPKATGLEALAKPSASHVWQSDTVDALNDGQLPTSSSDQGIPRLTWWDLKGSAAWVQYDVRDPQKVSQVEVYWFDDTGKGQCRVPKSWRVMYVDGKDWKPVEGASSEETKRDAFNRVTFNAAQTTGLRLELQLQSNVSGGSLEWRVH